MGNINDCPNLDSSSLSDYFFPFHFGNPLKAIYESDDELGALQHQEMGGIQTPIIKQGTSIEAKLDSDKSERSD